MDDLTTLQRDLLYAIAGEDRPSGVAVKAVLDEYYEKDVLHGNLYQTIDVLVDKGLVEKGEKDGRTNYYNLTERGVKKLEARQKWERQQFEEPE
ncbi:PadR family transcriptional regulator [Halorhabdus rudnickae]|uniref:PadR family transcriptional regulator n=1 Tax=Halorhabdus rudnickae TaxID=1775544 RepID=UPI001082D736|nr:helix-turn-helix transcriptional regulator [Halorhabdus rudnickae]